MNLDIRCTFIGWFMEEIIVKWWWCWSYMLDIQYVVSSMDPFKGRYVQVIVSTAKKIFHPLLRAVGIHFHSKTNVICQFWFVRRSHFWVIDEDFYNMQIYIVVASFYKKFNWCIISKLQFIAIKSLIFFFCAHCACRFIKSAYLSATCYE